MREGETFLKDIHFEDNTNINGTPEGCISGRNMFGRKRFYSPLEDVISHSL